MDMAKSNDDLPENDPALVLAQHSFFLDVLQKVSLFSVLHHDQDLIVSFEDFEKPDDVGVLDFL
jgi:hypothetical protein